VDIASLGIRVTTQGAKEAANDLDKLQQSGGRAEQATQKFGKSANTAAKSAKELQFATRNLPAQFTDIATALGSGQRPLQVLLQQGGQIKDMFGGIGPALRAVGSSVAGWINPFTLAAGAFVGLSAAMVQAEDQAASLGRALILSGNQANLTVRQLRSMAEELDNTTRATTGQASEVLAQVASTGRFTADQIELVARAAINMREATGQATEDTVKDFARLKEAPTDYILKLNEAGAVNNFLTESTIRTIEKLEAQGKTAEAAAVAYKAYADAINTREPELEHNLASGAAIWRDMKSGILEAGDAVVQFFVKADTAVQGFLQRHQQTAEKIADIMAATHLPGIADVGVMLGSATRNAAGNPAAQPAASSTFNFATASGGRIVDSSAERARMDAEKEFAALALSNLSKRERLEDEIKKIREKGVAAGKSEAEVDKAIADARARYAESLPKGPKARKPRAESDSAIQNASDRFDDMVGSLRAELQGPLQKAESEHLRTMREIQQAAEKGKRSHEDLAGALKLEGEAYNKTTDDIKARYAVEVGQLSGPVAAAQAAHEDALRRIDELTKESGASAEQHAKMLQAEARAYDADMQAAKRAEDPMGALLDDMRFELDLLGKSNAERETAIQLRELERQGIKGNHDALLALNQAYEDERRGVQIMDDFRSSASDALYDFVTGAKSAKDALKDFFDELARQITRAIADQWIQKLFGQQGTNGAGTSGGGLISGLVGLITGGGGGEQWYANGGAFEGGLQKFAYGGVVSSPTNFGMSGGRLGLMGEAGPEAIIPLHRGPDGKLGVRMEAANEPVRTGPTVVNQTVVVQGRIDSRTADQFAQSTARAQNRASARNR
jgi:phage-related minor tail protein